MGKSEKNTRCPNEEILCDYQEGRLSEDKRLAVEDHISRCRMCRELLYVYGSLDDAAVALEGAAVPDRVTEKALEAVGAVPEDGAYARAFRSLSRQVKDGVRHFGRTLTGFRGPDAVLVRSRSHSAVHDVVLVTKSLAGMEAAIEIEKSGETRASLRVDLVSRKTPLVPVRVVLCQGEREVASFLSDGSPALFEELPFGSYRLAFFSRGDCIGDYAFELRESDHDH